MTQSIDAGDFEEYPVGTQALIRVASGEVKVGDHRNTAERQVASYTPDHGWFEWIPSQSERLVIFAVSDSEVDVQYNDGFSVSLFGYPMFSVQADIGDDFGVSRPDDQSLQNNQYQFEHVPSTSVSSGFDTGIEVWAAASEERILEMVTFRSTDRSVDWDWFPSTFDADGNQTSWTYCRYPDRMVVQFEPGIFVESGGASGLDVVVRQDSGSSESCSISANWRPA